MGQFLLLLLEILKGDRKSSMEEKVVETTHVDDRGRQLYKIKCADCGKETEVPFKPDGRRPVYCSDCYRKHRPKRFSSRRF